MARSRSEKIQDAYQKGKDRAYTGGSDPGKTTVVDVVTEVHTLIWATFSQI